MRLEASRATGLNGVMAVPGDKSLSHRALMLGALAVGETTLRGLLEGEDVLATAAVLRQLGAEITRLAAGHYRLHGFGVGGGREPDDVLDFGNAGTSVRLMMGVLAGHPHSAILTGDVSLRRRPMGRVAAPLRQMGAVLEGRDGDRLPLRLVGPDDLVPITYHSPVASAQVKSAVLLAGLHAPGATSVIEAAATRDHTERMLRRFGATVELAEHGAGRAITVQGEAELRACDLDLPRDPSSAAFPLIACLITPDSAVRLPEIMINPLRTGLLTTLAEMGADLRLENQREQAGEPVADLAVTSAALRGIEVPAERAPSMIDEYPILAVAAACARGTTVMRGLHELRVKESDRLSAVAQGLARCGVKVEVEGDDLLVHGTGRPPPGDALIDCNHDHRIGMSFAVLGGVSEAAVQIDGAETILTSFPGFAAGMNALGASIHEITP